MQITKQLYFILFSSFLLLLIPSIAYAQLGEVAGQPFFNVSIGSSESITITIINSGSTPIPFRVVLPTLNTIVNTTQPIVTASPSSGAIPAGSSMSINVTVQMPSDKRNIGHTWTGVLQINEVSNATTGPGMGAVITAGVAKIITIYASPPKFNPFIYVIASIIIAAIVVVLVYLLVVRKRAPARAKARAVRKAPLKRVTVKAKAVRRKAAGRRPAARRRKAARGAKPRARSTVARRRRRR
ncbi:MAG: hypothetical protein QXG73_03885 [Candidatus Micrarchaeaceae archaeon]